MKSQFEPLFNNSEFIEALVAQTSYRGFLKCFIDEKRKKNSGYSYAVFSQKAGFKSKSFIRDVIENHKRLTPNSVEKCLKGLDLPPLLEEYFKTLLKDDTSSSQLEELREKVKYGLSPLKTLDLIFQDHKLPRIYAALGLPGKEVSFETLKKRTQLSQEDLEEGLQSLRELSLLCEAPQTEGRPFYYTTQLFAQASERNENIFQSYFLASLKQLEASSKLNFKDRKKLFFTSCFLIRENDMEKLISKLKKTIEDFVLAAENSDGDKIAELVLGFESDLPQPPKDFSNH